MIPDDRLKGVLRYSIHGVRMMCMLAIVMAFLGYFGEWRTLMPSEPLTGQACERVGPRLVSDDQTGRFSATD